MSDIETPQQAYAPIKLGYGHINIANERGWHAGCAAVIFKRPWWHRLAFWLTWDPTDAMNEFFETKAHAALVAQISPLGGNAVMVLFTKRLTGDDAEEMNEYNAHYVEWKEERKAKRLEAEEKAREAAQKDLERKLAEREKLKKRLNVLANWGVKYLKNVKKSPEEVAQAQRDLEELAHLDDEPVVVKDDTKTEEIK